MENTKSSLNESFREWLDTLSYETRDSVFASMLKIKRDRDELLVACKLIMARLADGTIVRDTRRDGDSDFASRVVTFGKELASLQAAILRAEGLW